MQVFYYLRQINNNNNFRYVFSDKYIFSVDQVSVTSNKT